MNRCSSDPITLIISYRPNILDEIDTFVYFMLIRNIILQIYLHVIRSFPSKSLMSFSIKTKRFKNKELKVESFIYYNYLRF